jgi:hypothetical protein
MSTEKDRVLSLAAKAMGRDPGDLDAWPVKNPFFNEWSFWRVEEGSLPPLTVHVGSRAGEALLLKFEDGFVTVTKAEAARLLSPDAAVDYLRFFIELTRIDLEVLDSIDDVAGVRHEHEGRFDDIITTPTATMTGDDYRITAYLLDGADLVRGVFKIDARGALTPKLEMLQEGFSFLSTLE